MRLQGVSLDAMDASITILIDDNFIIINGRIIFDIFIEYYTDLLVFIRYSFFM